MIRVLHVIQRMDCGGTENLIMNLYRHIDRSRVQFDFLVHTQDRCFFDDEIVSLGGRIFNVPRYRLTNAFTYYRSVDTLLKEHQEWPIVHGHIGSNACWYLRAAKRNHRYAIAHSHGVNSRDITLKNILYQIHAYFTRGVPDFYMGCSYEAGRDRYGKTIAESGNYVVLKNAIDASAYTFNLNTREKIRKESGIGDQFVIGHVGRFHSVKNHAFMMDVFSSFLHDNPRSLLLFVGDGELREEIEQKAEDLHIQDHLILTGVRNDVPSLLMAMDAFVFPSKNEGLGISLIEAQAAGLRCLASEEGIPKAAKISDLVEFVSLSGGVDQWCDKLVEIKNSQYQRRDMTSVVAKAGYDISAAASWLCHFYEEKLLKE